MVRGDDVQIKGNHECRIHSKCDVGMRFEEPLRLRPELQTHLLVGSGPLRTRDALYGVHTEAMRLHYRVKKGGEETI